jgi:hypothetical protein
VLLSQVHRQRALELLGRFLDFGPWAVNLVRFGCFMQFFFFKNGVSGILLDVYGLDFKI